MIRNFSKIDEKTLLPVRKKMEEIQNDGIKRKKNMEGKSIYKKIKSAVLSKPEMIRNFSKIGEKTLLPVQKKWKKSKMIDLNGIKRKKNMKGKSNRKWKK